MSIQTRSKRRNSRDRGARSAKTKYESLFFSGALKRLQKSKVRRSKERGTLTIEGNGYENESPSTFSLPAECHENGNIRHVSTQPFVRSSLFEKFKIPKLSTNAIENIEKFSAFEYNNNDAREMKFKAKNDDEPVCSNHDLHYGKLNCAVRPMFEDLPLSHEQSWSKEKIGIEIFASEILLDVKKKIDSSFAKDSQSKNSMIINPQDRKIVKKENLFEELPRMAVGKNSLNEVKTIATEYLNSFLSTIWETDNNQERLLKENPADNLPTQYLDHERNFCFPPAMNYSVQNEAESCSFGDTLCNEGFLSKPLNVLPTCPWPTSESCLLSNRVENKNGQIFVVKEKKNTKHQKREILADIKKKKRSLMLGNPPKYITPMEYHNRILEHREHLERRQWQNIVYSQDYENLFHDKPPSKIPEYIYHNQKRHAQTTNSQLLGYLACRASLFTDETWERIEGMAEETRYHLQDLSPFHIDHFFYQLFFFSTAYLKGMKRSKKRKKSNLYQYFQPELYILPPHLLPKHQNPMLKCNPNSEKSSQATMQNNQSFGVPIDGNQNLTSQTYPADMKEAVPSLPEVPRASTSSPSKSPELRAVENVYCYKRKSASSF